MHGQFVRAALVEKIRTQMEREGTSRAELARKIRNTPAYLSQVFSGKTLPSETKLKAIARALGVRETIFEQWIVEAKEHELSRLRPIGTDTSRDRLVRSLVDQGLDPDDDIPAILSYVDFHKSKRHASPSHLSPGE